MMVGWTIYAKPKDFPDKFVARRWCALDGEVLATEDHFADKDLDTVRRHVRRKMNGRGVNMGRQPGDDPVILETWL